MSISTVDCWKLIIQSRLLSPQHCQRLSAQFGRLQGEGHPTNANQLIDWLIRENQLSRYQGDILLSGRDGPFHFGNYKIRDQIKEGRLAGCYRAIHTETNHPVMLQCFSSSGGTGLTAFCTGATQLVHPNIVRIYESFWNQATLYLVFEDLHGASLDETNRPAGAVVPEVCRIASQLASSLAYMHSADWVHGDLRSGNIWHEQSGGLKLLLNPQETKRIGPAATSQLDADQSSSASKLHASRARDVRALGRLLFQLATGNPTVVMALDGPGRRTMLAQLPAPLDELVDRLTAPDPVDPALIAPRLQSLAPAECIPATPPLPTQQRYLDWLAADAPTTRRPPVQLDRAGAPIDPERRTDKLPSVDVSDVPNVNASRHKRHGSAGRKHRSRTKRRNRLFVGLVSAMGLCCVALIVAGWMAGGTQDVVTAPAPFQGKLTRTPIEPEDPITTLIDIEDDGETLWASPTAGQPVALKYLPGGAQVLVIARLSDIARSPEGNRVLQALGPDFQQLYDEWLSAVGIQVESIEWLAVGLYGNDGQPPRVAVTVHLRTATTAAELLKVWADPVPETVGLTTYYQGPTWAFAIPNGRHIRTFTMGHPVEIKELAEASLRPLPLRREMARLLAVTDRERHLNVLFAPRFLFGDGQSLFTGRRRGVQDWLESLLGEDVRAGLLSLNFGQELFFVEFRGVLAAGVDRSKTALRLRDRLAALPNDSEAVLASQNPEKYWRIVALRFPSMLRFLIQQLRVGIEQGLPTLNAALPPPAAHNLFFGGEMFLLAGSFDKPPGDERSFAASGVNSLEETLALRLSMRFDQESLETALESIETEFRSVHGELPFPFKIVVVGEELKREGITRNQQIRDFDKQDQTLAEILTALAMQANPVAVESASDPGQRILWVVGPDPDNPTEDAILFTARTPATGKYRIPEIFRQD